MIPAKAQSSGRCIAALVLAMLMAVCLQAVGSGSAAADAVVAGGPTPYPTHPEQWPGRGQARVFPWMIENRLAFWKQRPNKQGAVVLTGDSLVGNWRTAEKDFSGLLVANRGIGGDTSRGLLFRFREDVLDLHPQAVVILIGTNDLSALQDPAATVFNIALMIEARDEQQPTLPIVLCTLPPRENSAAIIDARNLALLNSSIRKMASEQREVSVLDLYPLFVDEEEALVPSYFQADRMHLAPTGYQRWRDALARHLADAGIYQVQQ